MTDIDLGEVDIRSFTLQSKQLDVFFVTLTLWVFIDFIKKVHDMCAKTKFRKPAGKRGSNRPGSQYMSHDDGQDSYA
tara:strand:- start:550 stop:780 length:231 start_codon:yes stop_codon:yes gene_type:complete